VNEYIAAGKNFHQETTLSAVGFEKYVTKAIQNNFEIHMYYVILSSPELAFRRAELGRHVKKDRTQVIDKDTLTERYFKSQKFFKPIFKHCNYVEVFDNSSVMTQMWIYDGKKFIVPNWEGLRASVTNKLYEAVSSGCNDS
jgi:predicted ABC-type ATPase